MTTDNGGWTVVARLIYPSNYDDIFYALNDSAYGTGAPNLTSATAWSDWRVLANVDWPIEMAVLIDHYYDSWGSAPAKVIYRVKSREVMPSYGQTHDLISDDNLYYQFDLGSPWLDVGSSSVSSSTTWFSYSSTNQFLTGLSRGSSYIYGTLFGKGVPGGDDTWLHSSWWLVR